MQPYQFRNGGRNAVLLRWRPASAQFTIRMEYKGVECTTELALTPDMIEHLALEAQRRRRATITNTQTPSVLPLNAGGLNDACALPQCDGSPGHRMQAAS